MKNYTKFKVSIVPSEARCHVETDWLFGTRCHLLGVYSESTLSTPPRKRVESFVSCYLPPRRYFDITRIWSIDFNGN
jgi:hypothetical protein